ncbi:MAG: RNA polymerase sigma-54 factor [Treponema sp. GWB1_62_6]|nr:MAG: RNA polymerase sigma-54 factor [Treponema sp. GWB1_62_6]OHE65243.1 MAG: RNA polymerase sigma-54 factor [Treponema sp. GWC1_61_84]OHE75863.1 MAG: RNA polymerase sigma-54 factor [Treponema sp. RIFOXYC1_FULL_61_9]HCM26405.1 RNA polymerase sigma-54 factor [Treponema sp.]
MQLQRPSFAQEQRLKMNPQLFQSIKLMALPVVDLRERIEEELEKNPALEVLEDKTTVSLDDYSPRKEEDDYFEATSDSGFERRGSGDEDSDEQRKFIEGVLSRPETLQDHLLWQFRLQPISPEARRIGELLIQNLDSDGFHKEPVDLLLKGADPALIASTIDLIRGLEPQGTCVSDYKESLLVQARLMPNPPDGIEELISTYLELLDRGKIAEVAKRMKRTESEISAALERMKELYPFPGRRYDTGDTRFVVPDLQIVRKEGEFVIILNDEEIPVLGINPFFMKLSDGKDGEKPVRDFVKENIKEARWFIRSINQRNHTLLRVARAIVEFQRSFFANGPKQLAPLTLKDIAQEIGVHETTVSRIANGKFIQTEWGIFEIRHFFTNSISGAGSAGSRFSKSGVKELLKEMIASEARRLSDQEIAELLARRGIPLARRTVAKYRKELDLGSSYDR